MPNSVQSLKLSPLENSKSETDARREEFIAAERAYSELIEASERDLGSTIDPRLYAQRQKELDTAMYETMQRLDALIGSRAARLEDVLAKLDVVSHIVDGTDQSPAEQLALSAREDIQRLLSS